MTVTIDVKRRSFAATLVRLPGALRQHYRIFRRTNGRIVSFYAAWLWARMLLTFE